MGSFRRFKISITLLMMLSVFTAVGGHWFALQGVAWIRMAISYSAKADVKVAVQKTFDGKHPCQLCHEIEKNQKPVKTETAQFQVKLDLFIPSASAFALFPETAEVIRFSESPDLNAHTSSPPTPPPELHLFFS